MPSAISSMVVSTVASRSSRSPGGLRADTVAPPGRAVVGDDPHRDPYVAPGRDPYGAPGAPPVAAAAEATAAASARVRTPSLVRMRPTWCSAVLGEMYSRSAMAALPR